MQTLFGEFEDKNEKALKIVAKGARTLSKNQQTFNKLTKRIETLESEIIAENEKLSQLLVINGKEITPLQIKVAHLRVKLAEALAETIPINKFTKKQIESIREVIVVQCLHAFNYIEPNPQQESFYDNWADIPYREEIEVQAEETKEMFAKYISNMYGIDVDIDSFDDSPEGFARFQAQMHEQFEQSGHGQHQPNFKKSKKQQAREDALIAEESIKAKNIRSIYIALAKVMHPDTESDESLKAEKEEIMKKVTAAYDQKDLPALLKLEIEWVHKTAEHLEKLTDDKLKIYISALRQQVSELESERDSLHQHPRYAAISDYARFPLRNAMYLINQDKSDLKNIYTNLSDLISSFQGPISKKQILDFINSYPRESDEDDSDNNFNHFKRSFR
ncbi:MAG: hypothetical protein Q7U54_02965 [Bacteroidales bacterium]|nr:hypothetical protein [Bacteroidales bacterium]